MEKKIAALKDSSFFTMIAGLRKVVVLSEDVFMMRSKIFPSAPARRVMAAAILKNPFTRSNEINDDLSELINLGYDVGELIGKKAMSVLDMPVVSYGKACIVGTDGQLEHGAAVRQNLTSS